MREARSSLVVLSDLKLSVNSAACTSGEGQVKPRRMVRPTAKTLPVMAAQRRAWRWGIGMAHRWYGVARRLDGTPAHWLLGHGRTLPAHRPLITATLGAC